VTLDPVHVNGIAELAGAIARAVDDEDHGDLARTVWEEFLDPLEVGGRAILEPLGEQRLGRAAVDDVALIEPPFPTVHGLDSGTINPTTFKNGVVLDVAQAAMASVPSDLDLHRSRSLVCTVHSADATITLGEDWETYDEGYGRRRVLHAPRVNRFAEGVVHALSLYLAESEHALVHANTVRDLLVLDGPIYPKELARWGDRDPELGDLAREAKPRAVVRNYLRLVETFVEKDVPLLGFVKNPAGSAVTRALRDRGIDVPWANDTALFTRLLERHDERRRAGERGADAAADGGAGAPDPGESRLTGDLTFSSWFVSRGGVDRRFAADGDALGVERELDSRAYEITFFVVYDPRRDLCFRVEAPRAFTSDPDLREALTRQVLRDVAVTRGPPEAVEKADELARVGVDEKAALRRKFEERFGSESIRTYDDARWGGEF